MNIHTKPLNIPINESLHWFTYHYLNMVRYNMLYSLPAILDLMLSHYQLMKKQDGSGFYTVEDVFTAYEITKFLQHSKQVDLKMVHDKIVAFFHLVNNDVLKNDKKLTPLKPLYKLYDGSLTYEQVKDKDGTLLELKGWSE